MEYVSNVKQFPKLSEQQIQQLLVTARNGNKQAYEQIILSNLQTVCQQAEKWGYSCYQNGVDIFDLIGAGNLALVKAINKYDSQKGPWYFYSIKYIKGYIKNEFDKLAPLISKNKCDKKNGKDENGGMKYSFISLSAAAYYNGEDKPLTYEEVIPSRENLETEVLNRCEIEMLLDSLPKKAGNSGKLYKKILEMYFGVGSYKEKGPFKLEQIRKEVSPWLSKESVRKIKNAGINFLIRKVKRGNGF